MPTQPFIERRIEVAIFPNYELISGKGGPYGKQSKKRVVPLSRRLQALLEPYFALNERWFIGPRQVQKIVKRARISQNVTPHVLRHYLPFPIMSCNGQPLRIWIGNFRSRPAKPRNITQHSPVPVTDCSRSRETVAIAHIATRHSDVAGMCQQVLEAFRRSR